MAELNGANHLKGLKLMAGHTRILPVIFLERYVFLLIIVEIEFSLYLVY